jgi:putative DNA primase/helicase
MAWLGDERGDAEEITEEKKQETKRKAIEALKPEDWLTDKHIDFSELDEELLGYSQDDYANKLIKEYNLKTLQDTREIYYYDKERGIFVEGAETILEKRIDDDLGQPSFDDKCKLHEPTLTTRKVTEYLNRIRRRTYINREEFNPSIEWIGCLDCMINLRTGETRSFSAEFMNTNYIPIFYNKPGHGYVLDFFELVEENRCPAIMKFLHDIMNDEDIEFFLDFLAYCLWREYRFNSWLLLNGKGFNGKSLLLRLVETFFGMHNVAVESLDRLVRERFSVANLYQKMVNLDADISKEIITKEESGRLKKLTGNDESPAEFKFKPAFKFRNFAKLIFSCNEVPETEDKTDAFFRRLTIINCVRQFWGELEDPHLFEKLTTKEELTGLLYVLIGRLPRILKRGIRPTTNESMAATYEKYVASVDPTEFFYEKALRTSNDLNHREAKKTVYDSYLWLCRVKGLTPDSDQAFSRKIKNKGYQYKEFRVKQGGKAYYWLGLEILDWKAQEDKEQQVLDFIDAEEPLLPANKM